MSEMHTRTKCKNGYVVSTVTFSAYFEEGDCNFAETAYIKDGTTTIVDKYTTVEDAVTGHAHHINKCGGQAWFV